MSGKKALKKLGAALLLALSVAFWVVRLRSSDGSLAEMAAPARRALYERTLQTLRDCAAPPESLVGQHCRQQAEFALRFPECQRSCQELAARWATQPSR